MHPTPPPPHRKHDVPGLTTLQRDVEAAAAAVVRLEQLHEDACVLASRLPSEYDTAGAQARRLADTLGDRYDRAVGALAEAESALAVASGRPHAFAEAC